MRPSGTVPVRAPKLGLQQQSQLLPKPGDLMVAPCCVLCGCLTRWNPTPWPTAEACTVSVAGWVVGGAAWNRSACHMLDNK